MQLTFPLSGGKFSTSLKRKSSSQFSIPGLNQLFLYPSVKLFLNSAPLPNSQEDWIETRYLTKIQNAVHFVTHQSLEIRFIILDMPEPALIETTLVEASDTQDTLPQQSLPATKAQEIKPLARVYPPAVDEAPCVLNPKYIFETFVIGNSNRFAHAASLAVAEVPGKGI